MTQAPTSRIRELQPVVVNRIAAGEVIERPASVVKELLENSLDALSTRIDVEIEEGGADLIRIVDDGEGIHPDDLLLAVTSHATSKIETSDDLFSVQTMGFRGEALASIASVSRFRLRTRQTDQEIGCELEVDGGAMGRVRPCGCPTGTQIEVRQLFLNTPVRRKFLKTRATEFSHISEQFTRIALANPRLAMSLRHNGKAVYQLPSSPNVLDRLQTFLGHETAEQLIRVESEMPVAGDSDSTGRIRLWGYVGHPNHSRSSRKGQYLFLNGRWIQDRSLQHALSEAYRGLLMVGRHPVAYLFLEMPASLVDVNVHPCKWEVRFRDGQQLYRQLLACIRQQFLSMDLDGQMQLRNSTESSAPMSSEAVPRIPWQAVLPESPIPRHPGLLTGDGPFDHTPKPSDAMNATVGDFDALGEPADWDSDPSMQSAVSTGQPVTQDAQPDPPFSRHHRAIQVDDCYLVLGTERGLMVIDQHALHERIMYEHLKDRISGGQIERQRLLLPLTMEMGAGDAQTLLENRELLKDLGFELEEFGGSTILLASYPAILKKADHARLLMDLCERLQQPGSKPDSRDLLDELLQMMSCKAAIKSGQRLSPEEMDALLDQRHLVDDAHHCPHGRPTALVLSRGELDRQFGRLG